MIFYWVMFDEPQMDADRDGPYIGAEIDAAYLRPGASVTRRRGAEPGTLDFAWYEDSRTGQKVEYKALIRDVQVAAGDDRPATERYQAVLRTKRRLMVASSIKVVIATLLFAGVAFLLFTFSPWMTVIPIIVYPAGVIIIVWAYHFALSALAEEIFKDSEVFRMAQRDGWVRKDVTPPR